MPVAKPVGRGPVILSPQERLAAGGAAEAFEGRIQALFREGCRHLIADLRGVPEIDSAGVRALVRGHTTAQRLGGAFRIAAPSPPVRRLFALARLDGVFATYDSVQAALARPLPWSDIWRWVWGGAVCAVLVWGGLRWRDELAAPGAGIGGLFGGPGEALSITAHHPFVELLKMLAAALIGILITGVQRRVAHERTLTRSMEHAQILLCVSGALMMIIIGNSLARAFGIAGAASIVRFRTPVEDPKDVTILFLLMGLGMAIGLGAFALAGLGTVFLGVFLVLLGRIGDDRARTMMVALTTEGRDVPVAHVAGVFARNDVVFEPREISQGKESTVRYRATLRADTSLEELSAELIAGGASGIRSVSWESPKKRDDPGG
jgi:anti-anti-sigma factor